MSDLPLKDRIALVVGASRGIGYESALALAKAGDLPGAWRAAG